MTDTSTVGIPAAWVNLLHGLAVLARGRTDEFSPLHCERGQLTVMSDPARFTPDELALLGELGFHPGADGCFHSFLYGAA